mgnify:CR=1 FL=1
MRLALFDLDNTLLAGDSDHSWGEFLCETGRVDAVEYRARNDAFYADYCAGKLDVVAYQSFTQAILARTEAAELARWQAEFMAEVIEPIILAKGEALLREHREAGDKLVIITATNRFITAPIAAQVRNATGTLSIPEAVAAVVILYATTAALLWVAVHLFGAGSISYNARLRLSALRRPRADAA